MSEALDCTDALIADPLTLAREGRSLGETEQVDLKAAAHEAWSSAETADATPVTESTPTIHADEDRVRQLLENLFRNSVEHGSTDVTVTVEAAPNRFAVCDDGPGIPEDVQDRVFTSGFSTSDAGTRFGPSIAERIAGAHGWTVDLVARESGIGAPGSCSTSPTWTGPRDEVMGAVTASNRQHHPPVSGA